MFNTEIPDLPTPVLIVLGVVAVISILLLVAGLIGVYSTEERHLPGGLRRPAWYLLCFVNIVGPLAFFILRRREQALSNSSETERSGSDNAGTGDIIERLYG